MAAAEASGLAAEFPGNLPITFEETGPYGRTVSGFLGKSIYGVGMYVALFEKGFQHVEAALLSCVGDVMGKRTVEVIATAVITVLILPLFCTIGLLYNGVVTIIKTAYGVTLYSANKSKADRVVALQLFKQATKHACFAAIDLTAEFTPLAFAFAVLFAFGGEQVKERLVVVQEQILSGAVYNKIERWFRKAEAVVDDVE